jgi:hypothetical protein
MNKEFLKALPTAPTVCEGAPSRFDGLDDSALFDRSGEFVEFPVVKSLSRVAGIWPQELDRRPSPAACEFGMLFVHGAQQHCEPPPRRGRCSVRAASSTMVLVLLRAVESAYSGGAPTSFALNDFGSELEIGLAARALEIVKQRWLSVRRRLGEARTSSRACLSRWRSSADYYKPAHTKGLPVCVPCRQRRGPLHGGEGMPSAPLCSSEN